LSFESISGNSGKDKLTKVQAMPMSMFSACPLCSNIPDIDFISYYWVFSENTSENGKNVVEKSRALKIFVVTTAGTQWQNRLSEFWTFNRLDLT